MNEVVNHLDRGVVFDLYDGRGAGDPSRYKPFR